MDEYNKWKWVNEVSLPYESFILIFNWFNFTICKYGSVNVRDLMSMINKVINIGYKGEFVDFGYRWTENITLTKDCEVCVNDDIILCKFKLQPPQWKGES